MRPSDTGAGGGDASGLFSLGGEIRAVRPGEVHAVLTTVAPVGPMSDYLRPKVPGATVFFTVTLAARGGSALVDHVDALREAVRRTKAERPFRVDAFVVLPDHLHAVWTLPEDDADFSTRWGAIKARFSRAVTAVDGALGGFGGDDGRRVGGFHPPSPSKRKKCERGLWQRRYGEHHIRNEADHAAHVRYCWINPVKHGACACFLHIPLVSSIALKQKLRPCLRS